MNSIDSRTTLKSAPLVMNNNIVLYHIAFPIYMAIIKDMKVFAIRIISE